MRRFRLGRLLLGCHRCRDFQSMRQATLKRHKIEVLIGKPEVHHIAIADFVFLAFQAHFAGFFSRRFAA